MSSLIGFLLCLGDLESPSHELWKISPFTRPMWICTAYNIDINQPPCFNASFRFSRIELSQKLYNVNIICKYVFVSRLSTILLVMMLIDPLVLLLGTHSNLICLSCQQCPPLWPPTATKRQPQVDEAQGRAHLHEKAPHQHRQGKRVWSHPVGGQVFQVAKLQLPDREVLLRKIVMNQMEV